MFIPAPSLEVAVWVSELLFDLSRPPGVATDHDGTRRAVGWVVHPESGAVLLDFTTPLRVNVHPHVLEGYLAACLGQIVGMGLLSQAEADAVMALAQANVGKPVLVSDVVPASWQAQALTRAQAQAAGFFPGVPS